MAVSPILVDSCYYIQLLRERRDPLQALALTAATQDLVICGVVRCEVGRALREHAVRQRFQSFWDVMINVPTDNHLWQETERLLWELDRKGRIIPLTDALIACCAKRVGAIVLTFDHHFSQIPGLRVTEHLDE